MDIIRHEYDELSDSGTGDMGLGRRLVCNRYPT